MCNQIFNSRWNLPPASNFRLHKARLGSRESDHTKWPYKPKSNHCGPVIWLFATQNFPPGHNGKCCMLPHGFPRNLYEVCTQSLRSPVSISTNEGARKEWPKDPATSTQKVIQDSTCIPDLFFFGGELFLICFCTAQNVYPKYLISKCQDGGNKSLQLPSEFGSAYTDKQCYWQTNQNPDDLLD